MKSIKGFFAEFQKFASRGNFVDLAVGIVIGTSFNTVVTSLVTNVITPPLGLLLGKINFVDLAIPLGGTVKITYGVFVQAVVTFILTAFALFLIVRVINRVNDLAKLRQQGAGNPPAAADSPELTVLKEIRDAIRPPSEEQIEPQQDPIV